MAKVWKMVSLLALGVLFFAQSARCQGDDQLPGDYLTNAHVHTATTAPRGHLNGQAHARFGISGIDSLVNWNKHFDVAGYDSNGNPQHVWYYNMVGNPPEMGGTTVINAPIVPVSLDLRNADGSIRLDGQGHPLFYDVTPFIAPALNSPVFQNSTYSSSSTPTQITDAVQRAEFYNSMKPDWHTMLNPSVKATRTMILLRGTYRFSLNADGSCCRYVLVDINAFGSALFPATYPVDNSTPVGSAENAGDITTKDMSTFLFPNTYLYFNGDPNQCCVLGYHTYDFEPGTAANGNLQRNYVLNYSSWISPGLFGAAFQDITAVSHEVAETFNDPFVAADGIHNITPWWLSPDGNCQNNLEVGDVIEGLPNATFPVTMNGMTYHPQNEALLQWFEFEAPSSALGGVYSYPNGGTLTQLSAPQKAGCTP